MRLGLYDAVIKNNSLISKIYSCKLILITNYISLLNDDFINMNKKVVVNHRGIELFKGLVSRSKKVIERSTKEYGDPYGIYYGEIHLSLAN